MLDVFDQRPLLLETSIPQSFASARHCSPTHQTRIIVERGKKKSAGTSKKKKVEQSSITKKNEAIFS